MTIRPDLLIGGTLPEGKTLRDLAKALEFTCDVDLEELIAAAKEGRCARLDGYYELPNEELRLQLEGAGFGGMATAHAAHAHPEYLMYLHRDGTAGFPQTHVFSDEEMTSLYVEISLQEEETAQFDWLSTFRREAREALAWTPPPLVGEVGEAETDEMRVAWSCPACGHTWEAETDSAHDDECGACGTRNITPYWHGDPDNERGHDAALAELRKKRRDTYDRTHEALVASSRLLDKIHNWDGQDEKDRKDTYDRLQKLIWE